MIGLWRKSILFYQKTALCEGIVLVLKKRASLTLCKLLYSLGRAAFAPQTGDEAPALSFRKEAI
jgi:hypothetical protein